MRQSWELCLCCVTCSITQAKFTSVHVQSAGFSQSGWFFISVNQVLAFARAGKNYLLFFIPVQLYFIPLPGNLYLASHDVGKSCISLLAAVQVIMVMPPRAQGRSTRRSSPPFIDQTVLGVLSLADLRSLCIQHGLPSTGVWKTPASRAKHQPQWTSSPKEPIHQQRHSCSAWRFQRRC